VTSYDEYEPEEPRGWSPFAVALIAMLVLLLGLGGALFGINVANRNSQSPLATTSTDVPTQTPTPTLTATATPTPTATSAGSPAGDTFVLPDLAGLDFETARTTVRDLKLGWRLVFEGNGTDRTVRTSEPPAGAAVKKGDTVKIFVTGTAPLASVPGVEGLACAQAAGILVDHGLYPQYRTGRDGVVLSQTPGAADPQTLHWNDEVQISCG
jgi:hypothetical protein